MSLTGRGHGPLCQEQSATLGSISAPAVMTEMQMVETPQEGPHKMQVDTENGLRVTRGERWEEGMVREFGMDLYTLLYLKWMTHKDYCRAQ